MNERPTPRVLAASQALEFQDSIISKMNRHTPQLNKDILTRIARRMGGPLQSDEKLIEAEWEDNQQVEYLKKLMKERYEGRPPEVTPAEYFNVDHWDSLRKIRAEGIASADCYLVTDDMTALVSHASSSMPRQVLLETDLPSSGGFCVFEHCNWAGSHPSVSPDKFGIFPFTPKPEPDPSNPWIRALCWYETDSGVNVCLCDRNGLFGLGDTVFRYGEDSDSDQLKFLKAMWAIMGQTLAVVGTMEPARATRRRLEKSESPLSRRSIRIVLLRRRVYARHDDMGEERRHIEHMHRWMVSGHWRNQWLRSVQNHRLQWIAPYVKGPEDKPLVIRRTVNILAQ